MKRARIAVILGLIIISIVACVGYFAWDRWRKSVDSDHDEIPDYLEANKYHTDPLKPDTDGDGLSDKYEVDHGLDPLTPNPNVAYVLSRGLPEEYLTLVKKLDRDGVQQAEEKLFDDLLLADKELLRVETLLNYYAGISSDGKVTSSELKHAENFSTLVNEMYHVISQEPKAGDKLADTDYAAQLGLELKLDEVKASNATAFAVAEYAVAVREVRLTAGIGSTTIAHAGNTGQGLREKPSRLHTCNPERRLRS